MLRYIKAHKKILVDFLYSFAAYALPTVILQFAVQPLIAKHTTADENGLFIALFNVVKLMIGIFVMPLANLRLLKKQECEKTLALNELFNLLFLVAVSCTAVIGSLLNGFYRGFSLDIGDILRLLAILVLMGIHDYFMIEFRIILNYRKIVIDNLLIVTGYLLGIYLFLRTGMWELIFISGYLFGTAYVLLNTNLWKSAPRARKDGYLLRQYGELSASDLLKNASTYCDRLIIYPLLGGFDVSVYNAAAVVSKAISVLSAPLRNVLLSYIVNQNELTVSKRKIRKGIPLIVAAVGLIFFAFWGVSFVACKFLYPQYVSVATPFIPIIVLAIVVETSGSILNIVLLRFGRTQLQTIISSLKLGVYLVTITVLAVLLRTGLWGFCIAILVADIAFTVAVMIGLRKNINLIG